MDFRSNIKELLQEIAQNVGAETVFGESRQIGDKVIIPVAQVGYGGGGGGGQGEPEGKPTPEGAEMPSGMGMGAGVKAKPLGVVVVTEDMVEWMPTLDATRVVMTGFIVAVVGLLVLRSISCARRSSSED